MGFRHQLHEKWKMRQFVKKMSVEHPIPIKWTTKIDLPPESSGHCTRRRIQLRRERFDWPSFLAEKTFPSFIRSISPQRENRDLMLSWSFSLPLSQAVMLLMIPASSPASLLLKSTRKTKHSGPEQPWIQTEILGHSLVGSSVCSLARSLRSLPRSWKSEWLDGDLICVFFYSGL